MFSVQAHQHRSDCVNVLKILLTTVTKREVSFESFISSINRPLTCSALTATTGKLTQSCVVTNDQNRVSASLQRPGSERKQFLLLLSHLPGKQPIVCSQIPQWKVPQLITAPTKHVNPSEDETLILFELHWILIFPSSMKTLIKNIQRCLFL